MKLACRQGAYNAAYAYLNYSKMLFDRYFKGVQGRKGQASGAIVSGPHKYSFVFRKGSFLA